ncbi:MAG: gamma-glutamylcyclotransferase family protein [Chitinophagaceae bacterium]
MKQSIFKIFVYGSLRSGFHSPAYNYISKYFTLVGKAKAKGLLFDMGDYPVAKPSNDNNFIIGELYTITNKEAFDFAIAQLDDYEGLNGEEGEVSIYTRTIDDIFINETVEKAWVYWFTGDVTNKPIIKSGDVLAYVEQKKNR